jgi:D-3-phosphoglycerate dehydrogenase
MSKKIFVALSTFAEHGDAPLRLLDNSEFDYGLNPLGRRLIREEIVDMGKDATGIIAGVESYDASVLKNLPKLKCLSRCGVGIDNIDLVLAQKKNIVIRNTPDVVIRPVVELTIAMILDLMRKLSLHTGRLLRKEWKKSAGNLLAGKTVGILGLGRIGRSVSETLLKLDAKVIGTDIHPDTTWAEKCGVRIVSLEKLLAESDILSLHLSVISKAPFILGRKEISLMKEGAWVVNVSRGNLVDDNALFDALTSGKLGGAAMDVFPEEPYTGPLCDLDNMVMTPHVATLTKESRVQMEIDAVQNLLEVLSAQ